MLSRTVLFLAVVCLAIKAGILVSQDLAYSNIAELGRQATASDDARHLLYSNHFGEMGRTCRTDLLIPGTRLHMLNLDKQDVGADFDEWSRAFGAAYPFVLSAVRCSPSRSDAWIRYGLVSQAIAEEPLKISQIMAVAISLAPYERDQLVARLKLWRRLSPDTLIIANVSLNKDIDTILKYGDKKLVRQLLLSKSLMIRRATRKKLLRLL